MSQSSLLSVDFLCIPIGATHSAFGGGSWKSEVKRGQEPRVLFCYFLSPSIQIHLMNELRIDLNLTQMRLLPHSHDLMGLIPILSQPEASLNGTPLGLCASEWNALAIGLCFQLPHNG